MSKAHPHTLSFFDHAMTLGRERQRLGLTDEAARLFRRLARLPGLPLDYQEEAHYRLAEANLDQAAWRKARRHLAAAIAFQPDHAYYHYLMGIACGSDDTCDPGRALDHLRQANRLDPDNAEYLCDLGKQALLAGKPKEALTAFRRAVEIAPADVDVLRAAASGLREAGCADEAKKLVRAAQFRNPRDHRFRDIWNQLQFDVLRAEQDQARARWRIADEGPVVLRFVHPATQEPARAATHVTSSDATVRHDEAKTLPGPHRPRVRRPARKANP